MVDAAIATPPRRLNVLLIHPYITVRDPNIYLSEPLGLLCVASYLKQEFGDEVEVTILDLYAMRGNDPQPRGEGLFVMGVDEEDYIEAEIRRRRPDLVGIHSNFTAYAMDAFEVAQMAKRAMPETPIVVGGAHATIEADAILAENPSVDYVVRGEGELTLEEIVRALRGERDIESIDGMSYRAADGSGFQPPCKPTGSPDAQLRRRCDM